MQELTVTISVYLSQFANTLSVNDTFNIELIQINKVHLLNCGNNVEKLNYANLSFEMRVVTLS